MSKHPLPPEWENDEEAPACGADPVGPVSLGFLLKWMKGRLLTGDPRTRAPGQVKGGYVTARTSRIAERYLSDEASGGPIGYTRVAGSARLAWVSRVDLVTLFGPGADVELMEKYAANQKAAKTGRHGTRYNKQRD